jgi:hypothetical protein
MRKTILAGILVLALGPLTAQAGLMRVNFTVTATDGPLSGQSSTGFFTYDSSIAPPGGGFVTDPALTELSFLWDGILYDETSATWTQGSFDSSGAVTDFALCTNNRDTMGSGCSSGGIASGGWTLGTNSFQFTRAPQGPTPGIPCDYGGTNPVNCFQGSVTWELAVPAPATLALLGLGLLGVGYRCRQTG